VGGLALYSQLRAAVFGRGLLCFGFISHGHFFRVLRRAWKARGVIAEKEPQERRVVGCVGHGEDFAFLADCPQFRGDAAGAGQVRRRGLKTTFGSAIASAKSCATSGVAVAGTVIIWWFWCSAPSAAGLGGLRRACQG
jgi:hypothetical protein